MHLHRAEMQLQTLYHTKQKPQLMIFEKFCEMRKKTIERLKR